MTTSAPDRELAPAGDLRGLVADERFLGLPADRQRALAAQIDPRLGKLDAYGQDRLLTRLAPDPYAFTESRHGLPAGLLKRMHQLESSGGTNLVSPTGVRGPFQITGRTGRAYGLPEDQWNDELAQLATAGNILADNLRRSRGDLRAAVNLYADPADRAWYADRLLQGLPSAAEPGPATTTPTGGYLDPILGPGPAPEGFLQTTGARVLRHADQTGRGVRALGRLVGEGITPGNIPRAVESLGALTPLLYANPLIPLGGGAVETLTGSRTAGDVAEVGVAGAPLATRATAAIGRRLRPYTPQGRLRSAAIARTGEEVTSAADLARRRAGAAAATTGDEIANAARLQAELYERGGTELASAGRLGRAQELGPRVIGAANRQVETLTKAGQRAQATARRGVKGNVAGPLTALDDAPAPTFDPITGAMRPPRVDVPGRPAVPPATIGVPGRALPSAVAGGSPAVPATTRTVPVEKVTRGAIPPAGRAGQRAANETSAAAVSHARTVDPIRHADAIAAVQRVARDPDLSTALLRHATPEEAAWIAEAVSVGQPVRQLGPVAVSQQLPAGLPQASTTALPPLEAVPSSGLISKLAWGARLAAMGGGYFAGGGGAVGVAKALVGGGVELGAEKMLRAFLDAALNSPKASRLVGQLVSLDPQGRAFAATAAKLAAESTGEPKPRTLRRQ